MSNSPTSILDIFVEEFLTFSSNTIDILEKTEQFKQDNQFYHYTSLSSFQNVISNKSFRATSIYMLNDPNELVHGLPSLCKNLVPDVCRQINSNARTASIHGFPAFVFSLTELEDNMHFWDKYGDKHRGIRIGFTPGNLVEYWQDIDDVRVILAPVVYSCCENEFIGPYGKEFIDFKNSFVSRINAYKSGTELSPTDISNISFCMSIIASFIKRPEWSHEKEWRTLCIASGPFHSSIIGDFMGGAPVARLENKSPRTLEMLTNKGNSGRASKNVLKVGSLAGELDFIHYTTALLFKKATGYPVMWLFQKTSGFLPSRV